MHEPTRPSQRTIESLGRVTYETKPNASNLAAGVIIAVLLVAGGVALVGYLMRNMFLGGAHRPESFSDWVAAGLLTVIGVALAVGGVFLFRRMKALFGFRLLICAEGFYITRGGAETVFAWDEILSVRETVFSEKLPLFNDAAGELMPSTTSRAYSVVRCDGKEFHFDPNVIPRTSLLAGPLATAAQRHGFAWDTFEERE